MGSVSYQHIGHDPQHGEIAIWSMDDHWRVYDRRTFERPSGSWLDWSHENLFREIKRGASARAEIGRKFGSIHIADPHIGLSTHRLARILDALDAKYPDTRWFVFGPGFNGESVLAALAKRVLGRDRNDPPQ